MTWEVVYLPEAKKDLKDLDGSNLLLVRKAINKVSRNPLPDYEGGYGHPLANQRGRNLSGFLKIKLRAAGIRIVYKLMQQHGKMLIIIIGARADDEVYDAAAKRIQKHSI